MQILQRFLWWGCGQWGDREQEVLGTEEMGRGRNGERGSWNLRIRARHLRGEWKGLGRKGGLEQWVRRASLPNPNLERLEGFGWKERDVEVRLAMAEERACPKRSAKGGDSRKLSKIPLNNL